MAFAKFGDLRESIRSARGAARHVVRSGPRTYLEVRLPSEEESRRYGERLERALALVRGVRWARMNLALRHLVVEADASVPLEALLRPIERIERKSGLEALRFTSTRAHPGGLGSAQRARVEAFADLASVIIGVTATAAGRKVPDLAIDLVGALAAVDGIPEVRAFLRSNLGAEATDLLLTLINAVTNASAQGWGGPVTDFAVRRLQIAALEAQDALWDRREPSLGRDPRAHEDHPSLRGPSVSRRVAEPPAGPFERYAGKAVFGSLSGFGLGFTATHRLERAVASLIGGMPRAASNGRLAFRHRLTRTLAEHGVLVMRPSALAWLDRIDAVVIEGELFRPLTLAGGRHAPDPELEALVRAVKGAGLHLVVTHAEGIDPSWAHPDRRLPGEDQARASVRALQTEGRAVCYVTARSGPVLDAADLSIGVVRSGKTPWGVDLICAAGLHDARLVIEAIEPARRCSIQAVRISFAQAAAGLVMSVGGLRKRTVRRVMTASALANLFAVGNAVRLARDLEVPPVVTGRTPWHALGRHETLEGLETREAGLSESEARQRRTEVHPGGSGHALSTLILDELTNPFTPLLATGAGLSALMGAPLDAAIIMGVVAFNVSVGVTERRRIARALEALEQDERRRVRVLRSGEETQIDAKELVVGDIILLEAGEVVPGDARLLSAEALEIDESTLTGESMPVLKSTAPSEASAVADRSSMVFGDTVVAAGRAKAVVTAVGPETEAGKGMAALAHLRRRPSGVEARLEGLTELTAPLATLSGVLVLASGIARENEPDEVVGAAVSLSVAAIPEGLPLLATLAQLYAADRLRSRGVLARNPRALEALGRVDVLCADKTGTLTAGRIELRSVYDGERREEPAALGDEGRAVVTCAVRATPTPGSDGSLAHPTDRGVVAGAAAAGLGEDRGFMRIAELPFEPGRGFHATLGRIDGRLSIAMKGAPEVVLPRCARHRVDGRDEAFGDEAQRRWQAEGEAMAAEGLRVLAIAERETAERRADATRPIQADESFDEGSARDLTLLGLVGLSDPVRPAARDAVRHLERAGVRVVMITGDHPITARAIARELGFSEHAVATGAELDAMDDDALEARVADVAVFARVAPHQKVRIVSALQESGLTVAMTGDGANDAQAIRLADVGIALGERSTAAARQAADLVVAEERIEAIIDALLEARALWRAVRDAVGLLVGGNVGEIAFTVFGGLRLGRSPLNPRQLLLVNLLTDTAPALAMAIRPPRDRDPETLLREGPEASLGAALNREILVQGLATGCAGALAWGLYRNFRDDERADTVGLLAVVGSQLAQALARGGHATSVRRAALGSAAILLGVVEIPGLSQAFGCRPLGPIGLLTAASASVGATAATRLARRYLDGSKASHEKAGAESEAPRPPHTLDHERPHILPSGGVNSHTRTP